MDEKPKKRRWFQLHLSTCIVLMFVAGGLIWINVKESVKRKESQFTDSFVSVEEVRPQIGPQPGEINYVARGWPIPFELIEPIAAKYEWGGGLRYPPPYEGDSLTNVDHSDYYESELDDFYVPKSFSGIMWKPLILDSACGLGFLVLLTLVLEYLTRRRARLKSSSGK